MRERRGDVVNLGSFLLKPGILRMSLPWLSEPNGPSHQAARPWKNREFRPILSEKVGLLDPVTYQSSIGCTLLGPSAAPQRSDPTPVSCATMHRNPVYNGIPIPEPHTHASLPVLPGFDPSAAGPGKTQPLRAHLGRGRTLAGNAMNRP